MDSLVLAQHSLSDKQQCQCPTPALLPVTVRMTDEHAASVERVVRHAAAKLAEL